MVKKLHGEHPAYIWNGVFSTWDDACKAAKTVGGDGHGGEPWLQRITQQILDYRSEFKQYGIAMPPRPSNLPLVCAMTAPSAIVDFGGASGWCWDYLQNTLPDQRISSYVVVEIDEVVNYMKKTGIHTAPVAYQSLKDRLAPCDLLYCNSVLQYFGSNEPLVSLIERTAPQHVFLEEVVAKGKDDFFTLQSRRDSLIPYRFLGLRKLLQELSCAGYEEVIQYPYASPILGIIQPLDMSNFPEEKRLRYASSILLQKTKTQ